MDLFQKIALLKSYRRKIIDQKNKECHLEIGRIVLKKNTSNLITIEEHGQFVAGRYQHKTVNHYQWQLINERRLQLSHLRHTQHHPELLAIFNLNHKRLNMIVATPYHCGKDSYIATFSFTEQELKLNWRVQGPEKKLLIKSTYSFK